MLGLLYGVTEGRGQGRGVFITVPGTLDFTGLKQNSRLLVIGHQGFSGYLGILCFAGPFSCSSQHSGRWQR